MTTRTGKSALLIAGLMELVLAILSMPSTFLAIFTTAGLERPPQAIGSEGLLVLLVRITVPYLSRLAINFLYPGKNDVSLGRVPLVLHRQNGFLIVYHRC
ncbi:hypothetical protein AX14_003846 [Amanita brunnescens Koide BX004]|nr:hypothetical protein AX14_003846 [Amanita brunnescens Koide BX004]